MWIMEYQKYLRQANSLDDTELARETAIAQLISNFPKVNIDKLINTIEREDVFSKLLLEQERAYFFEKTRLNDLRLDVDIVVTIPGKYERLLDHIDTHRWYLGEQRGAEVDYQEAVESWYDHVYLPIVEVIRERGMLSEFPNRTETDLYLWIVRHQWYLKEAYGEDIPIEQAADEVSVRLSSAEEHGTFSWLKNAFRKLKGH
jgi:hypothetical protein